MAEGNGAIYNNFKEQILLGEMDLGNAADVIKMILVSGYTPDIDAHQVYADVSGDEYGTALGYTANGATLASQAVAQDDANDRATFNGDDVLWAGLGPLVPATPSHCILYDTTFDCLIVYWELGTTATNGGDYTLQFGATIMNLT